MPMARGTFTVWYRPAQPGQSGDKYEHGIQASNPESLWSQALAKCPSGMQPKSITWQHGGGSSTIWFAIAGKHESACWSPDVRARAFGA